MILRVVVSFFSVSFNRAKHVPRFTFRRVRLHKMNITELGSLHYSFFISFDFIPLHAIQCICLCSPYMPLIFGILNANLSLCLIFFGFCMCFFLPTKISEESYEAVVG